MSTNHEGKTLLIVEDDEVFRDRLQRSMERRELNVTAVAGVKAALEAIKESLPDFAIVDLRLVDGSGLTVIEALESRRAETRALILTGYGNIPTAVAAVHAGAMDYIAKPATAEEIFSALLVAPNEKHAPPPENTLSPEEARLGHIKAIYHKADGNISEAARRLNMHRRTLQRVLKRHQVSSHVPL